MKRFILLLAALPLAAQTVTISSQPVRYLLPVVGNVTVYSTMVCSSPGVTVSSSWGNVLQLAAIAGINVVDNVLVAPTAAKAESKTTTHKIVVGVGVIGLSALFAAAFHQPPPWLIEGAATLTGGAQILGGYFSQSEAKVQATINTALGALADPTAQFSVSNGACTVSKLFLGDYKAGFVPIKAVLGSVPTAPADAPKSIVPTGYTHPALDPHMEVSSNWYGAELDESDRASAEFVALMAMQTMR